MNDAPALCCFRLQGSPLALLWQCDHAGTELRIAEKTSDGAERLLAVLPAARNWALIPQPDGERWVLRWKADSKAGTVIAVLDTQGEYGWFECALSFYLNGTTPKWDVGFVEIPQGATAIRIGFRPSGDDWEWSVPSLETEAAGKQGIRISFDFKPHNELLEEDALDIQGALRIHIETCMILQPVTLWILRLNSQDIRPAAVKAFDAISSEESDSWPIEESGTKLRLEVTRGEEHSTKYRPRRSAVDERDIFVVKALPDGLVTCNLQGAGAVEGIEYCGGRLLAVNRDNPVLRKIEEYWTAQVQKTTNPEEDGAYASLPAAVRAYLTDHPEQFQETGGRNPDGLLPLSQVVAAFFSLPNAAEILMAMPPALVRFWLDEARRLTTIPEPAILIHCVENPGLLHAMVDYPGIAPMLRNLDPKSIPLPFTLHGLLNQWLSVPPAIIRVIENLPSTEVALYLEWINKRLMVPDEFAYCMTVGIHPRIARDAHTCCEEGRRMLAAIEGPEGGAPRSPLLESINAKATGPFENIETLRQLAQDAHIERQRLELDHKRAVRENAEKTEMARIAALAEFRMSLEKQLLDFATETFPDLTQNGSQESTVLFAKATDAANKLPRAREHDIEGELALTARIQKWETAARDCNIGVAANMWLVAIREKIAELASMGQAGTLRKQADAVMTRYGDTCSSLLPARRAVLAPLLNELFQLSSSDPDGKLGATLATFQAEYDASLADIKSVAATVAELNSALNQCGWDPVTIGSDIPKFAQGFDKHSSRIVAQLTEALRKHTEDATALSSLGLALKLALPSIPAVSRMPDLATLPLADQLAALTTGLHEFLALQQFTKNTQAQIRPTLEARIGQSRPEIVADFEWGDFESALRFIEGEPLVRELSKLYQEVFEEAFPLGWLSPEPPLTSDHWSEAYQKIFAEFRSFHSTRATNPDVKASIETLRARLAEIKTLRDKEELAQDGCTLRSLVHAQLRSRSEAALRALPDSPQGRVLREIPTDQWTVSNLTLAERQISQP